MLRFTIFFFLLVYSCVTCVLAQTPSARLLEDLLNLPAPPPVLNQFVPNEKDRGEGFYDQTKPPPDDAPLEDLLDYWSHNNSNDSFRYQPKPSDAVLKRLLAAIEDEPKKLSEYLTLLSGKPEEVELVQRLYRNFPESETDFEIVRWRNNVREWLKYNSDLFADELLAKARRVRDESTNTANERELHALARVDWNRAEPLLERLVADKTQPRSAVSALWAYYRRALDTENQSDAEKYRDELKKLVADRQALPSVRDKALDALTLSPAWEGRDEWYLSLLADETLFELKEGNSIFTGLTTMIAHSKPGKWNQEMTKLVGHENPAVRNAAVRNLVRALEIEKPDKDALRALLPWLLNPSWAPEIQDERTALIRALAEAEMPEAVPGLIAVLNGEGESDAENRGEAAKALAVYKDSRAVPALKLALGKEIVEEDLSDIIAALIACGGLTDAEQIAALEAYAREVSTPERREKLEQPETVIPTIASIGEHLSRAGEPSDGFARLFFERLKFWQKTDPAMAETLADFAENWTGAVVFANLLHRIEIGAAGVEDVILALTNRAEIREQAAESLRQMRGASGAGSGIAAVLLADENEMLDVLGGKDTEARIALLVAARLLRAKLPISEVAAYLNDKNPLQSLAAERYLEAEDSQTARGIILSKRPNEALILGARNAFIPNGKTFSHNEKLYQLFESIGAYSGFQDFAEIKKFEDKLRLEAKANENLEIYAFLPEFAAHQAVIRAEGKRAALTLYENPARRRERVLSEKELEALRIYWSEKEVDEQPPTLQSCHHGCPSTEFLRLTRRGGRRVFFTGYPQDAPEPFKGLYKLMEEYLLNGKFRQIYYLSEKIPNLEILYADDLLPVRAVWKNGDDLRVLIEDLERATKIREEIWTQQQKDSEAEIENAYQLANERQIARQFEHFAWREFKNGAHGERVAQPAEIGFIQVKPETQNANAARHINQKAAGFEIRAGEYNNAGLWKKSDADVTARQIAKGLYSNPIVTPDGKWAAAAKAVEGWHEPNGAVRINLQTGKEFKINLPPADNFYPVAFVAAHNKILLVRSRDEIAGSGEIPPHLEVVATKNPNPKTPEYYLLDPATGATQIVKGEFRPLAQQTVRALQPVSFAADTFWAAIPDEKDTSIGLYNAKTFAFKTLFKLPNIVFRSVDVWFDETGGKFYFVHEGHLLALPLPKTEANK